MKKTTSPILALLILLAATVLTGCGTSFYEIPYNVGVRYPYVEGKIVGHAHPSIIANDDKELQKCRLADRRRRCDIPNQELYRIGTDYYVKTEVVYTPVTKRSYRWDIVVQPSDFPVDDAARQEKTTYFCRVDEHRMDNDEWLESEHLPRIPDRRAGQAPILTEEEAMALNPVFIKKLENDWDVSFGSARNLEPRYSWAHYAMMPVTAATFVFIDLPCDIIGSTAAVFFFAGCWLFNL